MEKELQVIILLLCYIAILATVREMKTEKTSGGIIFLLIIIIALALFMFKTIISLN